MTRSVYSYCLGVLLFLLGLAVADVAQAAPRKITKCQTLSTPGSYVLGKNLTASGTCLVVAASDVVIDLAGFVVAGSGTGTGISDNDIQRSGIAVRNGTVRGFNIGVSLRGAPPSNFSTGVVIERVRATGNASHGIVVGSNSVVRDSTADANGGNGIDVFIDSLVTGNVSTGNGLNGILVGIGCTVTANVANANGIDGFVANAGSTLTGNTARGNIDDGFDVICPVNVIGNTALANTGTNLVLGGAGCNSNQNLAP